MKVLIVSHHALPHVGGLEVLVDMEVRALAAAGHEVVLVTSDLLGNAQTPVYPPSVRVVRVRACHFLERRFRLPFPVFSPGLLPILWREVGRCDVMHAHGFVFMNSALALIVGWLRDRPRILTDHGGIQHFRSRWIALAARCGIATVGRLSARLATKLVSYNTRVTRLLEQLAGTTTKSLFLANPVDRTRFYHPMPEQRRAARAAFGWDDRPRVLFAGRLIPEKGVLVLLQAADPAYELVFCGPADQALRDQLARSRATYFPPRPQAELLNLYHAADVLAAPSEVREGFPLVVQEALACGLPAVLSYDEGFEPYRVLPGLTLCERTPEAVRGAIKQALAEGRPAASAAAEQLCPPLDAWVKDLYRDAAPQRYPSCPAAERGAALRYRPLSEMPS